VGAALEPTFDKVFDTQRIYRLMLDAIARPGKIQTLPRLDVCPPPGLTSYLAALAFTLLDGETTFATLPANGCWHDYLALNTGARTAGADEAEFVILDGREHVPQLAGLSRGSLLSPEKGATVFALVDGVAAGGGGIRLMLTGPGVKGSVVLAVDGLHAANLADIGALNREYPLGVDTFFVDSRGNMAALPRSTSLRWEVLS